jgi:IS5 family transposase
MWRGEGGQEPGGQGQPRHEKRSTAVDAEGIPIGGATDSANRHDSPLLAPTLDNATELVGALPEEIIVHLDRGYDSELTRQRLVDRGLVAEISQKGKPSPRLGQRSAGS